MNFEEYVFLIKKEKKPFSFVAEDESVEIFSTLSENVLQLEYHTLEEQSGSYDIACSEDMEEMCQDLFERTSTQVFGSIF